MSRSRPSARSVQRDGLRELPAVAAATARSVRTGVPLARALATDGATAAGDAAGLAADLRRVGAAADRGVPTGDALASWAERDVPEPVRLFVAACRFGSSQGGDVAAALDGAAVSLLDQIEAADEARALASQARTSAAVLVALPLVGCVGFSLLDPEVARTLFATPSGWTCLVLGVSLDALGAWVLARMVRRALR